MHSMPKCVSAIFDRVDYHDSMNTTSESLLLRLQEPHPEGPDESAWQQFVELYTPLIFYWARKNGRSQTDASDLVQEVLTLVFQKLPEFRYDRTRSFRGWLRTVTLNKFRELTRRKAIINANTSEIAQLEIMDQAQSTWDINYARMLVAQTMEVMEGSCRRSWHQPLDRLLGKIKVNEAIAKSTGGPALTDGGAEATGKTIGFLLKKRSESATGSFLRRIALIVTLVFES